MSVTCGKSVVSPGTPIPSTNKTNCHWNIVESGVKHHNPNPCFILSEKIYLTYWSLIKVILHQFWVKKIFPWKFNLEYGGTFTKLANPCACLSSSPLHCGDWLTTVYNRTVLKNGSCCTVQPGKVSCLQKFRHFWMIIRDLFFESGSTEATKITKILQRYVIYISDQITVPYLYTETGNRRLNIVDGMFSLEERG